VAAYIIQETKITS